MRLFTRQLRSKIRVEKCHQKVKGLTHGFWRFIHLFQDLEIRSKYESLVQAICFSLGLWHFRQKLRTKIEVEKFHEKAKGLTHGFWRFFRQFQNPDISSEYKSLTQRISFCLYLRSFRRKLKSKYWVEKFHQKVKGLTHGFWRFFHHIQDPEVRSEYERLAEEIRFSYYLRLFRRQLRSKIWFKNFH